MAEQFRWSLYAAVVLLTVHAAHSHRSLQGLSCVNDFVRNVTCTWRNSSFDPSMNCWVSGVKITYIIRGEKRRDYLIRSCKLQQVGDFPRCTFSFESEIFNSFEKMPNISLTCNGTLVETHTNYIPTNHIKMHPPGAPNVSISANMTRISWTPCHPCSKFFKYFNFQVQIKHRHQSWDEVQNLLTEDQALVIVKKLKGHQQVRVRVKPGNKNSQWSDWSPTTTWMDQADQADSAFNPGQVSLFIRVTLALCLGLVLASLLVFYKCCIRKRLMREKPVPNPSKYFSTLHSVHGGNLKKWLNPLSAPDSFFVAHPRENISAVEVCDVWDVVPSTSPSSTSALLHPDPDHRRRTDHLSSSSSFYSNMGYFMSSYNSSSAQTRTSPYFSYQNNVLSPHKKLHLSLCPSFNSSSIYDCLKRDPHSPDSGFGIGSFEDQDVEVNVLDNDQSSPLLLHLPLSVPSLPPLPPSHPSGFSLGFDNKDMEEDTPIAASPAAAGTLSAWPVAGSMCRASSLPVDSGKSGYLTLKELQTTFSNKSI